ncbi:MAG: hypothetical protein QN229_04480 [Desulfurococcaceae archaeon TW002]
MRSILNLEHAGPGLGTYYFTWNPLIVRVSDDVWDLSDLGKALVRLPGELGTPNY